VIARHRRDRKKQKPTADDADAMDLGSFLKRCLGNHIRKNEVVRPILFVALLSKEGRELGPMPYAVQQGVNEYFSPARG
jgi:hypothetical protein